MSDVYMFDLRCRIREIWELVITVLLFPGDSAVELIHSCRESMPFGKIITFPFLAM